ncbi:hypothetical protein GOEFS_109_00040 [Gordonia effusa NBRC 100432]|uniref:Uncharacterized protein n=2 Tax=Gordonia effusa TaxID=263908 RepID=H0R5A8_9ACTN|nr:hypothetical protein GOEFS_109_00040 [Gordonia effusa NBRC 100432]
MERDPDGDVSATVFVDGHEVEATTVTIDPGRGWTRDEWVEAQAEMLAGVPSEARDVVRAAFARHDQSQFIEEEGMTYVIV